MTYLRVLVWLDRRINAVMRHLDPEGRAWAELADWSGRLVFRRLDYRNRVVEAAGFVLAKIEQQPLWVQYPTIGTMTTSNGSSSWSFTLVH